MAKMCLERDVDNGERVQGAGEQVVLDGEVQGGDLLLLESDRIHLLIIHPFTLSKSICQCVFVQCSMSECMYNV